MQLEEYFEFEPSDRIRLKGTRIAIEIVLEHHLQGVSPEEIVQRYHPNLSLEQVYACITYYLQNRTEVDTYMRRNREADETAYAEHMKREPPEVVKRLLALRAQQRGVQPK